MQVFVNQRTVSGLYMRYSSLLVDEADYHRTGERSTHRYYDGESKIHAHSPSDPYSHAALDSICQSLIVAGYGCTIIQPSCSILHHLRVLIFVQGTRLSPLLDGGRSTVTQPKEIKYDYCRDGSTAPASVLCTSVLDSYFYRGTK